MPSIELFEGWKSETPSSSMARDPAPREGMGIMEARTKTRTERHDALQAMADRLRLHSLRMTHDAGSGHPTSCLSCAELVSVLFFDFLRFDVANPKNPSNDRFLLSKGHASPIFWASWAEAGAFPLTALQGYRRFDSNLEGHPTPRNPWAEAATGSLGQGLSIGVGMAHASRLDGIQNRIFVLMGDGETAEGSVWEAAAQAAYDKLDHLTAILDVNRLGQSGPTRYEHDLGIYARRFEAFGWHAECVDGHDVQEIEAGLASLLATRHRPGILIARTIKGQGVPEIADQDGHHGKPVTGRAYEEALRRLEALAGTAPRLAVQAPVERVTREQMEAAREFDPALFPAPEAGPPTATRKAYGTALAKLGAIHPRIVVLDGDVKNSTYSERFAQEFAGRFLECFIAEQNMIGMATGLSVRGWIPFLSTFAAFLTRGSDFVRMAAVSGTDLKICGSHCGVSIGEDGPSQMGLEDLAMMRALHGSTVFYPSDAVSAERLTALSASIPGIVYLRTSRPDTPVLYGPGDEFHAGGSKVLRASDHDRATIVAAGVTLHEALQAQERLAGKGVPVRVIDLYSVKPLDEDALGKAAAETGRVVVVEDHRPEGGIGEAVAGALSGSRVAYRHLAVREMPRSGTKEELMAFAGIDADHIVEAVSQLLGG